MEIDEPAPTFDIRGAGPELSLDLDSVAGHRSRTCSSSTRRRRAFRALRRLRQSRAASAAASACRPWRSRPPISPRAGDDLDFITEHLTEAEVFAKYGLAEKAAEHLRAVLERAPANLTAHERLFRILLEEGDIDGARTAAQAYVAVLEEKGDSATIAAVKNEFVVARRTLRAGAGARADAVRSRRSPRSRSTTSRAPTRR